MENSTHDYTLHLFLVSFVCETFNVGRGRFLTIGRKPEHGRSAWLHPIHN